MRFPIDLRGKVNNNAGDVTASTLRFCLNISTAKAGVGVEAA